MSNKSHATHYIKITLTKDSSLRFFYNFKDRPELINKWVLKSKDQDAYVLDERGATLIAETYGLTLNTYLEIIGNRITTSDGNIRYRKIIIDDKGNIKITHEQVFSKDEPYETIHYTKIPLTEPNSDSTIIKSIQLAISSDVVMEISKDNVYTEIESAVDYVIHTFMDDGDVIIVLQEGYTRGNTESYKKEEFITKFKIKGK